MTSIFCVDCLYALAASKVPGHSRTTLIVCPDSILRQWLDEVEKHVSAGHLTVFHYKGHTAKIDAKSLEGALLIFNNLIAPISYCVHTVCSHSRLREDSLKRALLIQR